MYNGDLEVDRPAAVRRFTDECNRAEAFLVVMPEFNRSLPAVLKNAIDWGSKPLTENVWRDKPIAMTGTSPGAIGTAVGQQHLRQILGILGAAVLGGEAYISFKPGSHRERRDTAGRRYRGIPACLPRALRAVRRQAARQMMPADSSREPTTYYPSRPAPDRHGRPGLPGCGERDGSK